MRFGDFHLDVGARQLFREGREIRISPKAFELLQLLVEQRTRAVAKAEIHERLWPGTFVSEANLASLVAELRRALDDPPQSSKYIRTVHRFGYAFKATVDDSSDAGAQPAARACWIVWNGREIPLAEGENIVGRDADVAVHARFAERLPPPRPHRRLRRQRDARRSRQQERHDAAAVASDVAGGAERSRRAAD